MIYLALSVAAFIAFSISLICGGGAGLLLIPILGFALPAAQVRLHYLLAPLSVQLQNSACFIDMLIGKLSEVFYQWQYLVLSLVRGC